MKKKSEKSWREFEELVTRIEATLSPKDAILKSPDKLIDNITQQLREVDASIKYKIGTTEILIIIECREMKKVQDTRWIEQLVSKQRDVGAAKCIAVTSNGFTKPAIKKAKSFGIEPRHMKKITTETISNWVPIRTWFYNYELKHVDLSFGVGNYEKLNQELDKEINDELVNKYYLEDNILHSKNSNETISIREYIEDIINSSYNELSEKDKLKIKTNEEYIMSFAGHPQYFVECSKGKLDVICVGFIIIFKTFIDYSLKSTVAFNYSDEKKDLIKGFEFDISSRDGEKKKLTLHKDLTSKNSKISIWKND